MKKIITTERKAHLYALMAWNEQYTREQAEEIAFTTEYSELGGITWAEDSIITAYNGISEKIRNGELDTHAKNTPEEWDNIIHILVKIHNNWVKDNAKKYNRGNAQASEDNLFQHLPTALIGIEELAKDLMFLAPFLELIGLNAGEMDLVPKGKFKPSEELIQAYNRYVEKYMEKYGIYSVEDLSRHIENCIDGGYSYIAPISEVAEKRIAYMQANVGLLSMSVIDKNQECFGSLELS